MARNHAANIRQGQRIVNGRVKSTRSKTEVGTYGNSRPKADKSVRRANEVANDPRLQRAKEQQAKHEQMLRELDTQLARQPHIPYQHPVMEQVVLTEPCPEPETPTFSVSWDALELLQQGYHVNRVAARVGVPVAQLRHLVSKDGYIE